MLVGRKRRISQVRSGTYREKRDKVESEEVVDIIDAP
jgi:hypothetical protein